METERKIRLMICGDGRHGKDTAADILRNVFGLTFESSSMVMAEEMYDRIGKDMGYGTIEDFYKNRHKHRSLWFELIAALNYKDPAFLSRKIFGKYDIYVGNRNPREFSAAKEEGLFDYSIYVDASTRLGNVESQSSNRIKASMCDFIVYNNLGISEFKEALVDLYNELLSEKKFVGRYHGLECY